MVARHSAEGKGSGVSLSDLFFYAYRVEDGKVARVEFCQSPAEALEAVGLQG